MEPCSAPGNVIQVIGGGVHVCLVDDIAVFALVGGCKPAEAGNSDYICVCQSEHRSVLMLVCAMAHATAAIKDQMGLALRFGIKVQMGLWLHEPGIVLPNCTRCMRPLSRLTWLHN